MITRDDTPVARLVPIQPPACDREPGLAAGQVMTSDDFAEPLPPDALADFER